MVQAVSLILELRWHQQVCVMFVAWFLFLGKYQWFNMTSLIKWHSLDYKGIQSLIIPIKKLYHVCYSINIIQTTSSVYFWIIYFNLDIVWFCLFLSIEMNRMDIDNMKYNVLILLVIWLQGKRWARLPRSNDWSLLLHSKESEQGSLIRRRELLRQNQRQLSTRSYLPLGWRSRGSVVVRVWLRGDQSYPVLLNQLPLPRLLSDVEIW